MPNEVIDRVHFFARNVPRGLNFGNRTGVDDTDPFDSDGESYHSDDDSDDGADGESVDYDDEEDDDDNDDNNAHRIAPPLQE